MALMTPDEFEESLKARHPRVFMNGKRVESVVNNPITHLTRDHFIRSTVKRRARMACASSRSLLIQSSKRVTHVPTAIAV
jgi:hypothetical protein